MDDELQRRFIHGMLTLVLGLLTAWLATYLTNKLLGEPRKV
jgi:predicted alpha/beta hydrolase